MNRKRRIWASVCIILAVAVWNWPVKYRVGVDGVLLERKIPLYAKACGYLYRDWMYKDIVKDITYARNDDLDKILAILSWTRENIRYGVPAGLKTVDDHPLNIVIRQYGAGDQLNDVFTILCSYAGYKSGTTKCFNADRTRSIILSLVREKGEWLIFDAVNGKYFLNRKGGIGSVGDYEKGNILLEPEDAAKYKEFLDGLKNADFSFTRADEQMPFKRIGAKVKKAFSKNIPDENY